MALSDRDPLTNRGGKVTFGTETEGFWLPRSREGFTPFGGERDPRGPLGNSQVQ